MNICLIALDTLRADHLGCYGYPRNTSPCLDALAHDGILFENPITNTAHTGPTFTTMYTGQYPFTHGIVNTLWGHPNEVDQLVDDTTPLLAEVLRKAGYLTAAFDNLMFWPSHPAHFARGYDYYVHTNAPGATSLAQVQAEQINARLLPFIDHTLRDPFFLFVHYWDPHQGYGAPEPWTRMQQGAPCLEEATAADGRPYTPRWGWRERLNDKAIDAIDRYDSEINYVDEHVRQVVEALKWNNLYDDTTIIITSDHGEDMMEHNSPFEHREPYETTVRVPLIVKPARSWAAAAPAVFKPQVGHIDLAPSILDLVGVDKPEGMDGVSWAPALTQGDDAVVHDRLFITGSDLKQEGRWRSPEMAVRTQTRKYIMRAPIWSEPGHIMTDVITLSKPGMLLPPGKSLDELGPSYLVDYFNSMPAEELYDLEADPDEVNNIVESQPEIAAELRAALEEHIATNPERFQAKRP